MRGPVVAIPAAVLLLVISAVASAGPREPELGRLAADGPVTLASNQPGVALLHGEHLKPGDRVSGLISLTNKGDQPGDLALGVTGRRDRPGARGGRLSSVLRLRIEDLSGGMAPRETQLDRAGVFALGKLSGRETRSYRVSAIFPDGGIPAGPFAGDNLQQGSSVEVQLNWQLTTPDPVAPAPPATSPGSPIPPTTQPGSPRGAARPPLVWLRIPAQRVIGPRGLKLYATCQVACKLRFTAKIDSAPKGHKKRHTLLAKRVVRKQRHLRRIQAGHTKKVFLKLTPRGLKRLKRQLHRRGRVGITVTAHMRSKAGNRNARRRIVMRTYKRGERRRASALHG